MRLDTLALQIILRQPAAPVKKAYLCVVRNDDAMTQAEDAQLQRLEVNIRRLVDIVAEQNAKLVRLKEQLREQGEALAVMQRELDKARQQEATSALASALTSTEASGLDRAYGRQLLDQIISEVDRCIQQLSSE